MRAGLEVLDEAGIDGLTMRNVAARLGVQSASLYWHVRDKDELLALIADAICAEIEPPTSDQPWIDQLVAMAWEYRRVLLAHRDAALVLANTPPVGPNRLGLAERMLTVLVQIGDRARRRRQGGHAVHGLRDQRGHRGGSHPGHDAMRSVPMPKVPLPGACTGGSQAYRPTSTRRWSHLPQI